MYQNGVDVLALKEILGHEQLNTTQIYTHVNNDILRRAAEQNPLANLNRRSAAQQRHDDSDGGNDEKET